MAPDGRAVDAVVRVVGHRPGQSRRDRLPDARVPPTPEALVYGHPLSVFLGHVAPRCARPGSPENTVDDGPVIRSRAAFATTLRRQEILQYAPFRFAQITSAQERLLSKEDP